MNDFLENNPVVQKEDYVYRFLPLKYFLLLLEKRTLYFPRISKWSDPYELFLFKQHFVDSAGRTVETMPQSEQIYGECWTTQRDSDALWRIYSPDLMSVRIKTTISQIKRLAEENTKNGLYIQQGLVDYKSQQEIEAWLKSLSPFSMNIHDFVDSLFVKRNSFSHEKEYRIVIWQTDFNEKDCFISPSTFIELPFNPNDFIKEVYLDPRLPSEEVSLLKHAIALKMGNTCPVSQSRLYQIKPKTIVII